MNGPLNLVQGNFGTISRIPIFIQNSTLNETFGTNRTCECVSQGGCCCQDFHVLSRKGQGKHGNQGGNHGHACVLLASGNCQRTALLWMVLEASCWLTD